MKHWITYPLIRHPYDIGNAQSLPWGQGRDADGFDNGDPNYNTKPLSADTLTILDSSAPVLAETAARRAPHRLCAYATEVRPSREIDHTLSEAVRFTRFRARQKTWGSSLGGSPHA